MALPVNSVLDFGNARRITNLAAANAAGQPVTFEQLNAAIENIAWKDNVRVRAATNVTISAPGTAIDGVTLSNGDRVLLAGQTTTSQNGLYIFNGSATPMTRSLDATTVDELKSAVVTVDEGTSAGSTFRQTTVTGTIDSVAIAWVSFGTSAPAASETTAGILEIATQAETDAGTDDLRAVTPLKLKTTTLFTKKYATNIGDGSATSIVVTHNLNSLDVQVYAYEVGGSKREVFVEKQHTSANTVTFVFDTAPASNSIRAVVIG